MKTITPAPAFTATQCYSVEDKSMFYFKFTKFILAGSLPSQLTASLYRRLSTLFMHIAHFNQDGFCDVWLANDAKRLAFIERLLQYSPVGNPANTWSDVEWAIQRWLVNHPEIVEVYRSMAQASSKAKDLKTLQELLLRYPEEARNLLGYRQT
jgi:hypothetical protein